MTGDDELRYMFPRKNGKLATFGCTLSVEEVDYIDRTIADLKAENAKLRELLQRTWDAFHNATAREFVTVKNELREVGVEVDA